MNNYKIGFTSVSLRSYSIEEVVDTAKKSGSEIIEWGSDKHIKTLEDAYKAKNLCDKNGILINSYGSYYRTGCSDEKTWKEICEIASVLGAKYIRTWLGKKGSAKTNENEYSRLLQDARNMADIADSYGLVISHECHPNTYNDTETSSLRFLTDVDRDNIKTYFQSWYRDEQSDMSKLVDTFPCISDIHISFSELIKFQRFHKKDKEYIEKIMNKLSELDFCGGVILEFTKNNSGKNLINDINRLKELRQRLSE